MFTEKDETDVISTSIKGRIFIYNKETEIFEDFEEYQLRDLYKNKELIEKMKMGLTEE